MRNLVLCLLAATAAYGQACAGYSQSVTVTINHLKVANTTQTNMPVLIGGTWSFLADTGHGGFMQSSSGYDICFSDSTNTTAYPFITTNFVNTTGYYVGRVRVPSLSAAADTSFLMWFGNAGVSSYQGNPGLTFSNGYYAVYEGGPGPAASGADLLGNLNLTVNGAIGETGRFYGANQTSSTGSLSSAATCGPANLVCPDSWSFEGWININGAPTNYGRIFQKGVDETSPYFDYALYFNGTNANQLVCGISTPGPNYNANTFTVNNNTWYYLSCSFDSATGNLYWAINGSAGVNAGTAGAINKEPGEALQVGTTDHGFGSVFAMEQLRFANVARNSDWSRTVFHNESDPGSFLTLSLNSLSLSGVSCAANSEMSIQCLWATNYPARSQVKCGTTNGGPYSNATGQVNTSYLATTSHKIVLAGLSASTAYYCVVLSGQQQSAQQGPITTGAATKSIPVVVHYDPQPVRYNNQFNGMTEGNTKTLLSTGSAITGDSNYPTAWTNNSLYGALGDTLGSYCPTGCGSSPSLPLWSYGQNIGFYTLSSDLLTYSMAGAFASFGQEAQTNQNSWNDNMDWKPFEPIAVNGCIYLPIYRVLASPPWSNADGTLVMSCDQGAHWFNPGNLWLYYTHGSSSGTSSDPPPGNGDTGNGTLGSAIMYPGANAQGNRFAIQGFVNPACQDSATNCVAYGGHDAWIYKLGQDFTTPYTYLARTRIEDVGLMDPGKDQFFTGGNCYSDTSWSSSMSSATPILNNSQWNASIWSMQFVPDFHSWITVGTDYEIGLVFLTSPTPCGPFAPAGYIPKLQSIAGLQIGYPTFAPSTYSLVQTAPLEATITAIGSGSYLGQAAENTPQLNNYSPFYYKLTLVGAPADAEQRPWSMSVDRHHVERGLDLAYQMTRQPGTPYKLQDVSPTGKYSVTLAQVGWDDYGLIPFGFCINYSLSCTPAFTSVATGYTSQLTDFTTLVVWKHLGAGPDQPGEVVLSKGSDLILARSGSSANTWTVTVQGTSIGNITLTDDSFGLLAIRRAGGVVKVYNTAAISTMTPTLGPVNTSGTWSNAVMTLGASLVGTISYLEQYKVALTDAELQKEARIIVKDLARRGVTTY